jgi:hypothetical protein
MGVSWSGSNRYFACALESKKKQLHDTKFRAEEYPMKRGEKTQSWLTMLEISGQQAALAKQYLVKCCCSFKLKTPD